MASKMLELRERAADYPIKLNSFDFHATDEMRENSEEWRKVEEARNEEWEDFGLGMDTFFNALYKPRTREEEALSKRGRAVKQILDEASKTTEWQDLRQYTVLDRVTSAMGAIAIGKSISLPEDLPKGSEGDEPGDEPVLSDEQVGEIRREVRKAIADAHEEIELQSMAEGLMWGNETGDAQTHSPAERMALAQRVKDNERLKRLARIVGKMRIVADKAYRNKVIHGRDELTDITLGDDIRDLVPTEFAFLAEEELESLFYYNFVEQNLLQYEFTDTENVGQGPIVARIDISGSMNNTLGGSNLYDLPPMSKLEWAIAVALSLTVMAKKEKRDLDIGFFDTQMKQRYTFPKGEVTPEEITEIASVGTAGGTAFEPPLNDALRVIREEGFTKADILFITDGISHVSTEFLEGFDAAKEEYEINVYSILLHYGESVVLNRISEDVLAIADLKDGEKAMDMAFNMGGRV